MRAVPSAGLEVLASLSPASEGRGFGARLFSITSSKVSVLNGLTRQGTSYTGNGGRDPSALPYQPISW